MRGAAPLDTDAAKAAWWERRFALDKRVASLLRRLDRGWLGPWGCLLAQPPAGAARAGELLAAARGFVAEQFEFVYGGCGGWFRIREGRRWRFGGTGVCRGARGGA